MADFCKQCSDELGFPNADLVGLGGSKLLGDGEGWPALCEHCGPTLVLDDGTCMYHPPGGSGQDCLKAGDMHNAIEFEKVT